MTMETVVFTRVRLRLIPFMFLLYVVNYLDRVNIGFAALQMNRDLGFGPEVYGIGAGIFFWGYLLFEIPSNLLMDRVGARIWIARIMVGWGLVSTSMMFVHSVPAFYGLRFLLGVAEAGFFPGMILYLTYWFPASERAKAVAQFMTATAIAGVIGGPLSGSLLTLNGTLGLSGWQWLFLLEGLPSILLGVVVFIYLTDRPEQAYWLTDEQRTWLIARMKEDRAARATAGAGAGQHASVIDALVNPIVWLFAMLYFCIVVCFYGVTFFLPTIVKHLSGLSDFQVGLVAAIPYVVAAVTMVLVGMSSDRTGERHLHLAASAIVGAVGLALSSMTTEPILALVTLSIAAAGIWGGLGPFWAMPTAYLSGTAAAGGIALINSIGNLGGFLGPSVVSCWRCA
jgi:MFS transporter, ACS family, tartrate transporter